MKNFQPPSLKQRIFRNSLETLIVLLIGISGVFALSSCSPSPTQGMVAYRDARFQITRVAVIDDDLAYDSRRGIYVIVDTKTGREYIGVSGVGISETGAHVEGKQVFPDER